MTITINGKTIPQPAHSMVGLVDPVTNTRFTVLASSADRAKAVAQALALVREHEQMRPEDELVMTWARELHPKAATVGSRHSDTLPYIAGDASLLSVGRLPGRIATAKACQ